jgi:hypothetical protein
MARPPVFGKHGKMSAMEGRPDGRRTRPEPPFLTQN